MLLLQCKRWCGGGWGGVPGEDNVWLSGMESDSINSLLLNTGTSICIMSIDVCASKQINE